MDSFSFLTSYFKDCNPDQFIELTYIHHDKTQPGHILPRFARIGDKSGLRDLLAYAARANADGYGIYFGVCPRATLPDVDKRGSETHVDTIVGFWTELDSVKEGRAVADDLNKLQSSTMPPSLCILSGGGVQGYWLLPEPIKLTDDNRALIKSALRGLGKSVGGDLQVAEYARVLRVPGFINTKPERNGARTELVLPAQKRRYTLPELVAYAPPPEAPRKPRDFAHESTDDRVELAQAALNALNPSRCDEYELWTYVGMALRELGSVGLSLWESWSSRSSKYRNGECERKWDTFDEHGLTLASLYHWADEDSGKSWRPIKIDITPIPPIRSTDTPSDGWSNGLTLGERGALYRFADPAAAALIEIWAASGLGNDDLDVDTLVCLAELHELSERKIRSAIKRLPVVFLTVDDTCIRSTSKKNLDSYVLESSCARELADRKKAGRPTTYYRLMDRADFHNWLMDIAVPQLIKETFKRKSPLIGPIHASFLEELGLNEDEARDKAKQLEQRYGKEISAQPGWKAAIGEVRKRVRDLREQLQDDRCAPLPDDAPLTKRRDLLAAAATTILKFFAGIFSGRKKFCQFIGCRNSELPSLRKLLGIAENQNTYAMRPIESLEELDAISPDYDKEYKGSPFEVVSSLDKRPMDFQSPNLKRWLEKQWFGGAELLLRYRQAYQYSFADPEPTIKQPEIVEPPKPTLIQPELIPLEKSSPFPAFWRVRLAIRFAARLLSALVMAVEVAKEAAWYIREHSQRVLKYGEAQLNKLIAKSNPAVARTIAVGKPDYAVQMSFELLLREPDG